MRAWPLLILPLVVTVSSQAAEENLTWQNIGAIRGTFQVADGVIVIPAGAPGVLRAERPYENFILEFDREGGAAPLLLWADGLPQVGADRPRGVEVPLPAGTHFRLEASHGRVRLLSADGAPTLVENAPLQRGYLCLEGGPEEIRYRNIHVTALPPSGLRPGQIAERDDGFRPLCDGPNLQGWKLADVTRKIWHAEGTHIFAVNADTPRSAGEPDLWTQKSCRDFELIADWRLTMKPVPHPLPTFTPDGLLIHDANGKQVRKVILNAGDSGIYLRGSPRYQVNIWSQPMGSGDINELHKDPNVPEAIRRAALPSVRADAPFGEWNRFYIRLTGDRLTVRLNGIKIIDNAQMLGIGPEGPIALQHEFHGSPIEFTNLYIHELNQPAAGGEMMIYKHTSDGQDLTLEILRPPGWAATDRRPAGLFFHGGSWTGGTPAQLAPQARHFAGRGMVCALADYRLLAPEKKTPPRVCVEDAKSAMRWLRAHAASLGIDPDRIAVFGASAGGQMAAFLANGRGLDDPADDAAVSVQPQALVLFNPVVDFAEREFGHEQMGDQWRQYSPLRGIAAGSPPTLLMVGSNDHILPSLSRYRTAMLAVGSRCDLKVYPGQGHSFFNYKADGNPYFDQTLAASDAFLVSLGWLR